MCGTSIPAPLTSVIWNGIDSNNTYFPGSKYVFLIETALEMELLLSVMVTT